MSVTSLYRPRWLHVVVLAALSFRNDECLAQIEFERPPIAYHDTPATDPVAMLQGQIDAGEVQLKYDEERGYLPAVLEELGIPRSSQMLVFSKTSFQLRKISPARPRAIYFNDDAYVGWVQQGDVVEISAVDPQLGGVYYTLSQEQVEKPQFIRDKGQCLTCHASSRTRGVPGHLVRSVFADHDGQPNFGSGTYTTDQTSPFQERWGGWYVTGTHGDMRHMGNVVAKSRIDPEGIDREKGANVTSLASLVDTSPYLEPTSDIVALMVLEHQTQMHNYITAARYEAISAGHYDGIMNQALERPADHVSESTQRRIASAGDKLVKYLLMSDEFPLTSPVSGTADFAREFESRGIRDSKGRSLRDLDLQTRVFKYPCSYLVYSPAFDALPQPVLTYIGGKLTEILEGDAPVEGFEHLNPDDRRVIAEILRVTKPGLLP